MKILIMSIFIFLIASIANSAQLYLKNGNRISGEIKRQNEKEVVLNIPDVGSVTFKMTEIEKIAENEYIPLDEIKNKNQLIIGTVEGSKSNQSPSTSNSEIKAIEHYNMAMKYYSSGNYDLAIEHFKKSAACESSFLGNPQYMIRKKIDSAMEKKSEIEGKKARQKAYMEKINNTYYKDKK